MIPLVKRLFWRVITRNERLFIRVKFRRTLGYSLNLKNPRTFNEKLQWIKLYYRKAEMVDLVDKYTAKQRIAEIIGNEYIIPTYGVYNSVSEIDWENLPISFVLKCTHDSGSIILCKDKSRFDYLNASLFLQERLNSDYYSQNHEWPYKNIDHRIICEKYMGSDIKDYKWFCFNGEPRMVMIAADRNTDKETTFDFFDMDFNHLPIRNGHNNAHNTIEKPSQFQKMKTIASQISQGYPHMRVDLYEIDGNIYFGEVTFFHWGGFVPFEPDYWDKKIGDWLALPTADR